MGHLVTKSTGNIMFVSSIMMPSGHSSFWTDRPTCPRALRLVPTPHTARHPHLAQKKPEASQVL
jgi:hypothetical protein